MNALCHQLFGCPWDELSLEALESLLAHARDSGLAWQALSGAVDQEALCRHACAFANSDAGGFLLVGVEGVPAGGWELTGAALPGEGPALWLDAAIESGVRPRPDFAARTFAVEGERTVAVMEIPPVAEPPCTTSDGAVHVRVSGASVPVADPAQLAALFERGARARRAAATAADALAHELLARVEGWPFRLTAALVPAAVARDVDAHLFTTAFDDGLRHAASLHLEADAAPAIGYAQDRVQASLEVADASHPRTWAVEATRGGAVGVAYADEGVARRTADVVARLAQPAWLAAVDLAAELGAGGSCELALVLAGGEELRDGPRDGTVEVKRSVGWGYPSREDLASVRRELARAGGRRVHEPG